MTSSLVLALICDPLSTFTHSTPELEQALALLRSSYGGGPEGPHFAAMRRAEDHICASLRIRAKLDAEPKPSTVKAPPAAKPPRMQGGQRVKAPRIPPPTRPPAGMVVDAMDIL